MSDEKVIWEEPSIPSFPMIRGETYFTKRDLQEMESNSLPHPDGIDPNTFKEVDILFETFCNMLEGSDKSILRALARSNVSPFDPKPLQVTSAIFENPGYYIPNKFHSLLIRVWLYQLGNLVAQLCGSSNK